MYLVEINSQMIGIVFNINFSTLSVFKCCQSRNMFLVYSFSIATQIDGTHIADCFPDIVIPMFVWKYLFFTIYLYINIYIYIKCELQSMCSILAFKCSLFVLILHNQTLIKVCETKGVEYFTFRNKILNISQ